MKVPTTFLTAACPALSFIAGVSLPFTVEDWLFTVGCTSFFGLCFAYQASLRDEGLFRTAASNLLRDPLFRALSIFTSVLLLASVYGGASIFDNDRLTYWGPLPILYAGAYLLGGRGIAPGVVAGFSVYACLHLAGVRVDNPNVFTANMAVAAAAMLVRQEHRSVIVAVGAVLSLGAHFFLDNHAFLLAWFFAVGVLYRNNKVLSAGIILFAVAAVGHHVTTRAEEPYHYRDLMFRSAWEHFLSFPFLGVGTSLEYSLLPRVPVIVPFSHNAILTVLAEQGLLGLLAFANLIYCVVRKISTFPISIRFLFVQLAVVSMVDEPLQGLGVLVSVVMLCAVGRVIPSTDLR